MDFASGSSSPSHAAAAALADNMLNNLMSIIPYWSAQLLNYLQLGNEYSMICNLLLSHVFRTYATSFTDQQWVLGATALVGILFVYKSFVVEFLLRFLFGRGKTDESRRNGLVNGRSYFMEGVEENLETTGAVYCQTGYMPEIHALHLHIRTKFPERKYLFVEGRTAGDEFMLPVDNICLDSERQIYLSLSRSGKTQLGLMGLSSAGAGGGNGGGHLTSGGNAANSPTNTISSSPQNSNPAGINVKSITFALYRLFVKQAWWQPRAWLLTDDDIHGLLREFIGRITDDYHRSSESSNSTVKTSSLVLRGRELDEGKTIDYHPYMIAIDKYIEDNRLMDTMRSIKHKKNSSSSPEVVSVSASKQCGIEAIDGRDSSDKDDSTFGVGAFKLTLEFPNEGVSSIRCALDQSVSLLAFRQGTTVTYTVSSEDHDRPIQQWMDAMYHDYKKKIMDGSEFKNKMKVVGQIHMRPHNLLNALPQRFSLNYSMWAISWYLHAVKNKEDMMMLVGNRFADNDCDNNLYSYVLGDTNDKPLLIEDDIFIKSSSENTETCGLFRDDQKVKSTVLTYTLMSYSSSLFDFMGSVEKKFSEYREQQEKIKKEKANSLEEDLVLMYFHYAGCNADGTLSFEYSYILNEAKGMKCYMTFQSVFHEHKEYMQTVLKQLDDETYYERTGRNRKAGLLLHGPPGTCKTGSAFALCMESKRHMIAINLQIVKTNDEFHRLMNIKRIRGVDITDRNSMYFFDEIEKGLQQLLLAELKLQNEMKRQKIKQEILMMSADKYQQSSLLAAASDCLTPDTVSSGTTIETTVSSISPKNESVHSKLSYITVLTLLDPGQPKHGALYVAAANEIDFLPDAFKRDLRLTMLYLGPSRQKDAYLIVRNQFDREKNPPEDEDRLIALFADRFWISTSLIAFADKWREVLPMEEFIETKIVERQRSS